MKVAVPLAKNILAPLEISTVASAIDAGIQKKYMILVVFHTLVFKQQL